MTYLTRRAGFRVLEGQALTAVAAVHLDQGELDLAIRRARHAATLHHEAGHRLGEARTLLVLGHALRQGGDTESAHSCLQRARALFQDVGSPESELAQPLP